LETDFEWLHLRETRRWCTVVEDRHPKSVEHRFEDNGYEFCIHFVNCEKRKLRSPVWRSGEPRRAKFDKIKNHGCVSKAANGPKLFDWQI